MFKKIAIIGLGNTLRRDDGVGIAVLESLLNFSRHKSIEYLHFGTASFDLVYRLKDYDAVLLIDGIDASLEPAELKICPLNRLKFSLKDSLSSSHELDLKSLFELCKRLKVKTKIYVAGIQVKDVSYGEGLSNVLKKRLKAITQEISAFIEAKFLLT